MKPTVADALQSLRVLARKLLRLCHIALLEAVAARFRDTSCDDIQKLARY
jgi:hypothetical protein